MKFILTMQVINYQIFGSGQQRLIITVMKVLRKFFLN